jgi:signal peptide peptidase SppA
LLPIIPNIFSESKKMFCCSRKQKIPVIALRGIVSQNGEVSFKKVNKLLKKVFDRPFIKTIAIVINSPGGSPAQAEMIFTRIRELANKHNVTVLTFIEDIGASAGYYIACAGDEIYALNSSIVGSIGVICSGFGFDEFIKKHGIQRRIYTQGENKAVLDSFLPERDSDIQIIQDLSKDIHNEFIDCVKTRRGEKLNSNDSTIFTGKVWSGKKAIEVGLIDGIGNVHSTLKKKYGENIKMIPIEESRSLISSLKSAIGLNTLFKTMFDQMISSVTEYNSYTKFEL